MSDRHANPADGAACLCISGSFFVVLFFVVFFFLTAVVIDFSVKRENLIPILKYIYTHRRVFF